MYRSKLNEKLQESLAAVLPILAIVLILSFTIAPLPTSVLMAFLFGAVLLVVGMMFFSLGAELAMSPMGERVGETVYLFDPNAFEMEITGAIEDIFEHVLLLRKPGATGAPIHWMIPKGSPEPLPQKTVTVSFPAESLMLLQP